MKTVFQPRGCSPQLVGAFISTPPFMCHSARSGARSPSKSLTLAHRLSSARSTSVQIRDPSRYRTDTRLPLTCQIAAPNLSKSPFLALPSVSAALCSPPVPPRPPFPSHFSLDISFSHLALLLPDTLNQGVIDNVSFSPTTSVNSLFSFWPLPTFSYVLRNFRRPFC